MLSRTILEMPFIVLMAEDSEHDIRATRRIWEKHSIRNPLVIVNDGEECWNYLTRQAQYSDPKLSPRPGVMILDLNLPKIDGFEILRRVKATPELKRLPVVVMSSSTRDEDQLRSYDLGANAFMTKPVGLDKLSASLLALNLFWELASLPSEQIHDHRW